MYLSNTKYTLYLFSLYIGKQTLAKYTYNILISLAINLYKATYYFKLTTMLSFNPDLAIT